MNLFKDTENGYSLDARGWAVAPKERIPETAGQLVGPVFTRNVGGFKMKCGLLISRSQSERLKKTNDDREYFKMLMKHAESHSQRDTGQSLEGIHLVWVNGESHGCYLYRREIPQTGETVWIHKYSVNVEFHGMTIEFLFSCGFFGPFRESCRYAHIFEDLVCSLKTFPTDVSRADFFRSGEVPFATPPTFAHAHYAQIRKKFPSPNTTLKLLHAETDGPNIVAAFEWKTLLSDSEADVVDIRLRAGINGAIGSIAKGIGLPIRKAPPQTDLLGVPIPSWFIGPRSQPTFVVNSRISMVERVIRLTIGTPSLDAGDFDFHGSDRTAFKLAEALTNSYSTITV